MNVVITGASAGIGRALAVEFASHGHPVLAVARRGPRLEQLCREMGSRHAAPITCFPLDITTEEAPAALLEEAVRVFGRVHVLINNAGMSPYQDFCDLAEEHLEQIIALNVRAPSRLCQRFLPHMLAHGEPSRLVNVSSLGGYAPLPRFAVYSASKHYLRILTNQLRREYRKTNVCICGLYPGGTLTEFARLSGQQFKPFARTGMMTAEKLAKKAYPAILKGRRVIAPGFINASGIVIGKVLPFPWVVRVMELLYAWSITPVPPEYPLHPGGAESAGKDGVGKEGQV